VLRNAQTVSEVHPPSCSRDAGVPFLGVKRPGREVDRSPPFNVEVKNGWNCTFASPVCPHGVYRNNETVPYTWKGHLNY
jgi:hypothetical protein